MTAHDSERIWRCSCGGHHFVSVTAFAGTSEDPGEAYLEVMLHDGAEGLWGRLRTAWDILVHGESCSGEVVLEPAIAVELVAEIRRVTGASDCRKAT